MTLKQLEALFWAAKLGSFALAANRLCMTQSTLSKRILELEDELGQTLFDRSGSRARITQAGEWVLQQAAQMLELKDAILAGEKGAQGVRGTCRFGVSELVASTWLADFVELATRTYPEVALEPRVGVTQDLLADVLRGETDMAIVPLESPDASVTSLRLQDVRMIWTCAPSVAQAGEVLTRERLPECTVVSTTSHAGATAALETWALRTGTTFKRVIACNSMGAVAALAAAGLGICVLPEPFARGLLRARRLVRLRAASDAMLPPLRYFLHWRKEDTGLLSSRMRELLAQVGSGAPW